jgi:paraquat-inducible protein B
MKDGQQFVRNADGRVIRMMESFTDTAKTAQATIVSGQRRVDDNLIPVLQEVTAAVRSIRVLVEFLERNPNALVTGRR